MVASVMKVLRQNKRGVQCKLQSENDFLFKKNWYMHGAGFIMSCTIQLIDRLI